MAEVRLEAREYGDQPERGQMAELMDLTVVQSPHSWEPGRLCHPARLLDMPPIVRHQQPEPIGDAVRHDTNEWRGHDRTRRPLIEEPRPLCRITMLLDESSDDVGGDAARRRSAMTSLVQRRLRKQRVI